MVRQHKQKNSVYVHITFNSITAIYTTLNTAMKMVLDSVHGRVYFYMRVHVCVCVCVCAHACVPLHNYLTSGQVSCTVMNKSLETSQVFKGQHSVVVYHRGKVCTSSQTGSYR